VSRQALNRDVLLQAGRVAAPSFNHKPYGVHNLKVVYFIWPFMCTLTNLRRIPPPPPEKFGAAASRILVGAGQRACVPAGFGPRQPENGRRRG